MITTIYSCKCGFCTSKILHPNVYGRVCPRCGTALSLVERKVPTYSPMVDPTVQLDISLKYRIELNKIARSLEHYKRILDLKVNDIINERDRELSSYESRKRSLEKERDWLFAKYHEECSDAIESNDISAASKTADEIRNIKNSIAELHAEMEAKIVEYSSTIETRIKECDEAKIVQNLFEMRDGYINRMKHDKAKYGDYINSIINIKNRYEDLLEYAEEITDYDDDYLSELCQDYKGKACYVKQANRIKTKIENDRALEELSRAREIANIRSRSIDIDPYSRYASRVCFESYVENIIAKYDESISGFKI